MSGLVSRYTGAAVRGRWAALAVQR